MNDSSWVTWAGTSVYVGSKTFSPRASSYGLVERATELLNLGRWKAPVPLIDMCSGSGALGIAIHRRSSASIKSVWLLDAQPDAVRSGAINLARHRVPGKSLLWFAGGALPAAGPGLVICNPPFLRPEEVAPHEPEWLRCALASAEDGGAVLAECLSSLTLASREGWVVLLKCAQEQLGRVSSALRGHRLAWHEAVPELEAVHVSCWEPEV